MNVRAYIAATGGVPRDATLQANAGNPGKPYAKTIIE
jgi:hypothetical protein